VVEVKRAGKTKVITKREEKEKKRREERRGKK